MDEIKNRPDDQMGGPERAMSASSCEFVFHPFPVVDRAVVACKANESGSFLIFRAA